MSAIVDLRWVAARVSKIASSKGNALIAIDGRSGSGKSSAASELARATGAAVVPIDDFYRVMPGRDREALDPESGYRKYFDWQRLKTEVLEPVQAGGSASYLPYDWDTVTFARSSRTIRATQGVIVEGVYSFRPELQGFYRFSLLVLTPRTVCLDRMRARGENEESWIQRWMQAEDWYFHHVLSEDDVDAVVDGTAG